MSSRRLPFLSWLRTYERGDLRGDLSAGLTTGVVLVPQSMAYAMLAGLPPIAGLYAALAAKLVYPLFGTSGQLSVAPVAMDSLLTAATLATVAQSGTSSHLEASILLTFLVGALQMVLGLLRAGYVANFLSRPVTCGFMAAAALIIATTQIEDALGLSLPKGASTFGRVRNAFAHISETNLIAFALTAVSFVVLRVLGKKAPKAPAALAVVVGCSLAYVGFGLKNYGITVVGNVPSGLPTLRGAAFDLELIKALFPGAITIALVSFMESLTNGLALARKHRDELVPSVELFAIGAANFASAAVTGLPVAGGLSRSAVNDRAGARTPLASVFAAVVVALSLLVLTPAFQLVPRAALAAVVLSAVIGLINVETPQFLYRVKRNDFWIYVLTLVATLTLGVTQGILLGVLASLSLFVVRTTRPHYAVLGHIPGTQAYLNVERHRTAQTHDGVLIVRMDAPLYFGNTSFLRDTLRALEEKALKPVRAVILDASGINQLDSSALDALMEIDRDYRERGIRLLFARVKGPVRDVMERSGMLAALREERRIFTRTHDAVECAVAYVQSRPEPCAVECLDLSQGVDPGIRTRVG